MMIPEKLKIGAKVYDVEITSHILDGTLMSWLAGWKMKSQMLVAFLLESNRANAQND